MAREFGHLNIPLGGDEMKLNMGATGRDQGSN